MNGPIPTPFFLHRTRRERERKPLFLLLLLTPTLKSLNSLSSKWRTSYTLFFKKLEKKKQLLHSSVFSLPATQVSKSDGFMLVMSLKKKLGEVS